MIDSSSGTEHVSLTVRSSPPSTSRGNARPSALTVAPMFFTLHLPVMLVALVLVRVYIFISPKRFSRWQGVPLLALYAFYIARLILLKQY